MATKIENIPINEADRMYQTAIGTRGTTNSTWSEVAELASPMDRIFQQSNTAGQKMRGKQYDELVEQVHDDATNHFISITTPSHSRYFALDTVALDDDGIAEQRELDETTSILFDVRYRPTAKFGEARFNSVRSFLGFGNGVMFVDKGPNKQTPVTYRFCHLSNTYLIVDGLDKIIGVFYSREMSPAQIVKEFGSENVSKHIIDKSESSQAMAQQENPDLITVVHMVLLNKDYDPNIKNSKNMRYISRHFISGGLNEDGNYLKEGGYRVMPYAVERDSHMPNEIYGRGTLVKLQNTIEMRNQAKRIWINASHRKGEPTYLGKDDSSINPRSIRPGYFIVGGIDAAGNKTVQTLDHNIETPELEAILMDTERTIMKSFNIDQLSSKATEGRDRVTAIEIQQRTLSQARSIGNHATIDEDQMQNGIVARELDILDNDWGMIPKRSVDTDDGEVLESIEHKIVYKSPQSVARKSGDVIAANQTLEALQVVGQTDPRMKHAYKPLEYVKIVVDGTGTPAKMMATEEEFNAGIKEEKDRELATTAMQNVSGITQGIQALEGSPNEGNI